jgi:hypothetical protein
VYLDTVGCDGAEPDSSSGRDPAPRRKASAASSAPPKHIALHSTTGNSAAANSQLTALLSLVSLVLATTQVAATMLM